MTCIPSPCDSRGLSPSMKMAQGPSLMSLYCNTRILVHSKICSPIKYNYLYDYNITYRDVYYRYYPSTEVDQIIFATYDIQSQDLVFIPGENIFTVFPGKL